MSVPIEVLPAHVQAACDDLRTGLLSILGDDIIALWLYGAVTFEDRSRGLGDIDTHAVIRRTPRAQTICEIDELHESTGRDHTVEWDSWYILERASRSSAPPAHAFRAHFVDDAWALHRAHWLAGQVVLLYGLAPSALVQTPTRSELDEGLVGEFRLIEHIVRNGQCSVGYAAFVVSNGCRIIYSKRMNDVVISKSTATRWALQHLPDSLHDAIHAARRAYDDQSKPNDEEVLRTSLQLMVTTVRRELGLTDAAG